MSQAFDVLSSAVDEAIENSKAEKKFLREETLSIEIESIRLDYRKKLRGKKSVRFGMEEQIMMNIRDTREHDRARDQKRDPARDRARDQYLAKEISARFGIDESVLYELFQECSKKFQKEMDVKFMI